MTVTNTAKRDVYRPTMRRQLLTPGNKGVEVIMVECNSDPNAPEPGPGPEYADLEMTDPVVTGDAIVGETLTCSEPTVTGGSGDHDFIYTWKLVDSSGTTFATGPEVVVPPGVVGKQGYCEVAVTDVTADQSISKNSNVVGPVAVAPLVVTDPVVTGGPFAGDTVTITEPVVSGGVGPYDIQYSKAYDSDNPATVFEDITAIIPLKDVGETIKCCAVVTDTGWKDGEVVTVYSNSIGPIEQREIGNVVVTVDGNVVAGEEPEDTIQTATGQEHIIILTPDGNATDLKSDFQVRSGEARISQTANSCIVTIQGAYPGSVHVQCKIEDRNTLEEEWSQRVVFIIRDGEERDFPPKATWEPLNPPLGELLEVQCNQKVTIDQEIESNYQVNYEWEVNDPYSVNTNPGEHGVAVNLANMQRLYPEMGWIEAIAAGPQLVLHCTNPPDGEQDNRFHLRFTAHSKHPGIEPPYQSSYTKVRFLP